MKLLFHKPSQAMLQRVVLNPRGSYLVIGPSQIGKFFYLEQIARTRVKHAQNLLIVASKEDSIGIAQIHELNQNLRLKTSVALPRIVIIRDAERMTIEAQNAFLKTLEEPPRDTSVFLVAQDRSRLLPTILSRLQELKCQSPSRAAVEDYLKHELNLSETKAKEIATSSRDAIGRAIRLAQEPAELEELKLTRDLSRQLLAATDIYEKLKLLSANESRLEGRQIITETLSQLRRQVREAATKGDSAQAAVYNRKILLCHRLLSYLESNGNAKLALNQLALGV